MTNETLRARWLGVWVLHVAALAAVAAFGDLLAIFLFGLLMDANMVRLWLRVGELDPKDPRS